MIGKLKRREGGFSLIELMVALLIIAVLIAISIPLYTGIRTRGQNAKAHSALTTAAKVEAAIATLDGEFTDNQGRLALEEPSLDWSGIDPEAVHIVVGEINVGSGLNEQVLLYAASGSGTWFGIRLVAVGGLAGRHTCEGPDVTDVNTLAGCVGSSW